MCNVDTTKISYFKRILLKTHEGWIPSGIGFAYRGTELTNPELRKNVASIRKRLTFEGLCEESKQGKDQLDVILESLYLLGVQDGIESKTKRTENR